jgi:hypothetical protein
VLLDALKADAELAEWVAGQEAEGAPRVPVEPPSADELPDLLLDLAVPYEDVNEIVAVRRTLFADAGAVRLLEACVGALVHGMGEEVERGPRFPVFPTDAGPVARHFYVYVFVAALPYVRAHHRERGIPDHVSRRTLADLGRAMALHRLRYGVGGVLVPGWLTLHFRGEVYQLGRLQFQRARVGERDVERVTGVGREPEAGPRPVASREAVVEPELRPGDPCLSLHIPDYRGPLTREACERSVAQAREFFARHFPEERYGLGCCHSWLLDPQLKRYLPDSNIARFQELFEVVHLDGEPSDRLPVRFVFGDPDLPVNGLPRRTGVERAVVDHLKAGGHWYVGHGWFRL